MRSEALPTDTVPDEEAASDATRSASGWRGLLGTVVVESGRRQQGDVAFFPPASLPQLVPGGSRRVSLQFSRHGATPESEEALSSSPVLLLRRWMLLHSRSISLPSPLPLRSILQEVWGDGCTLTPQVGFVELKRLPGVLRRGKPQQR